MDPGARFRAMYRTPPHKSSPVFSSGCALRMSAASIRKSAPSTARKLAPFRKKAPETPIVATRIPATAGPITRAPWNVPELSAMALARSSLPTSSMTKACRAGVSIAWAAPSRKASPITCHSRTVPVAHRMARTKARAIIAACVRKMIRRLEKRSAIAPACRVRGTRGIAPTKFTSPRSHADPVSWYTSQFCAIVCIHVPTREVSCPKNQRRKLRWRNAWKVEA